MALFSDELIRIMVSAIIGLAIGYTRRDKPAGMRTFALICLGSTIFTLVSLVNMGPNSDPSRIIGQIVTGIGFLGAGIIWKGQSKVGGLTTAAAAWITASIGVLIGLGMWPEAIATTIITIVILLSKHITEKLDHNKRNTSNWDLRRL
ncbi:MAG: MgtC/SapB family protein [Candidatus Micrarchaeota archaeon]|nr:MgtC/SapB family protein [Candidatus Micrarchaeota archaeon]